MKNITNTIKSIKSQNFKDFEYLIIDGNHQMVLLKKLKNIENLLIKSER